jgi:predicted site-specific integrase-resolvase
MAVRSRSRTSLLSNSYATQPKSQQPNLEATRGATQAVLYARVSSKDQQKEGFSIPAQ